MKDTEPKDILWIVGKTVGFNSDGCVWEYVGVFDKDSLAIAECITEEYFVGPVELNTAIHGDAETWPGCYYPIQK